MKKSLIFAVLMLAHLSTYAEGVDLNCSPAQPICDNCPEYQTLFPVEQFSENTGVLDIEADESEILEEKYLLSGNVEVNSENLYLSANDVEVSSADSSLLAKGNVKFQDASYLITGDLLSASMSSAPVFSENCSKGKRVWYSVQLSQMGWAGEQFRSTPSA